jgi:hypothetical protein
VITFTHHSLQNLKVICSLLCPSDDCSAPGLIPSLCGEDMARNFDFGVDEVSARLRILLMTSLKGRSIVSGVCDMLSF